MVPPMTTPGMGAVGNANAMDVLQHFYQLLLMQSIAAGNVPMNSSMLGMPAIKKEEPTSPVSTPPLSPNQALSIATSPLPAAASPSSPNMDALKTPSSPNMDALKNLQSITELINSAQSLKSQISPSVQQFKMADFGTTPSSRQYKVHVNRESAKPLQDWMNAHISDPYPTQKDVQQLAQETGFTHKQIRNWFTNSRRRFEQQCGSQNLPWQKKDAPRVCHRSSPPSTASNESSDMNIPSCKPEDKEEAQSDEVKAKEEEVPAAIPSSSIPEMVVKSELAEEEEGSSPPAVNQ